MILSQSHTKPEASGFSGRIPASLDNDPLYLALKKRKETHQKIIDLSQSNPTQVGFEYWNLWPTALNHPKAQIYEPAASGLLQCRASIASYYAERGILCEADQIHITCSTSEAYSHLFKLFCNPGDEVLFPLPSYPLIEDLAQLDSVVALPFPLTPPWKNQFKEAHLHHINTTILPGHWSLDLQAIRLRISTKTKLLLLVSPNNPTGHCLHQEEFNSLLELCRDYGLALVLDEVFVDYSFDSLALIFPEPTEQPLVFLLNGLSKTVALPQAKLAWILSLGPKENVKQVMDALGYIGDAYLSTSSAIQLACPELLSQRQDRVTAINSRLIENLNRLQQVILNQKLWTLYLPEAGWYALCRHRDCIDVEQFCLDMLESFGVYLHHGHYFGIEEETVIVLSLLCEEEQFSQGINLVFQEDRA